MKKIWIMITVLALAGALSACKQSPTPQEQAFAPETTEPLHEQTTVPEDSHQPEQPSTVTTPTEFDESYFDGEAEVDFSDFVTLPEQAQPETTAPTQPSQSQEQATEPGPTQPTEAPQQPATEGEPALTTAPQQAATEPEQAVTTAPQQATTEPEQAVTTVPQQATTEPEQAVTTVPQQTTTEPATAPNTEPAPPTTAPPSYGPDGYHNQIVRP